MGISTEIAGKRPEASSWGRGVLYAQKFFKYV